MTPDEQLEHERLIADILRIRKPPEPESPLRVWLNSPLLTALVGVIGTAVLGAWVSGVIQDRAKQNELERTAQETRLKEQSAEVDRALSLVATLVATSDDLLTTAHQMHAEADRLPEDARKLREWKTDVQVKRDAADSEWRRQQRRIQFRLGELFDGDEGVTGAWTQVRQSVDAFEVCTREWFNANAALMTPLTADKLCADTRSALDAAVEALTDATNVARRESLGEQASKN